MKSFQSIEQQIEFLHNEKGLLIPDIENARSALSKIGYYQLISGYKYLFKNRTTGKYRDGVAFEDILALYRFDEKLRQLFLQYLLIVERTIKTQIAYFFCAQYGEQQSAYLNTANYSANPRHRLGIERLIDTLSKLADSRSDYPYITHYQRHHHNVPLWVLINAVTFGSAAKMFSFLPQTLQSKICRNYPLNIRQMDQILSVLTKYRNACAHGERLFSYTTRDDIPDFVIHRKLHIPQNGQQYIYGKHDLFSVVIAFLFLLSPTEFRAFKKALSAIVNSFAAECTVIDETDLLHAMGFPKNWKSISLRYSLQ